MDTKTIIVCCQKCSRRALINPPSKAWMWNYPCPKCGYITTINVENAHTMSIYDGNAGLPELADKAIIDIRNIEEKNDK